MAEVSIPMFLPEEMARLFLQKKVKPSPDHF